MFTFFLQLVDLIKLQQVGLFFVFFLVSWVIHLYRLHKAGEYKWKYHPSLIALLGSPTVYPPNFSVSIIIPVADENKDIFRNVLNNVKDSVAGLDAQLIVVANGSKSDQAIKIVTEVGGFEVYREEEASKRKAIYIGSQHVTNDITMILDSDTIVDMDSIAYVLRAFHDPKVGGAMPKQSIFNRNNNIIRIVSDWLEDIRFREVVSGQSTNGAVSCLCGRLLAIRTDLLKQSVNGLVNQKFLGSPCISGDDRYLTSWLLKNNWKTVYIDIAEVYTDSPDTLKAFMRQRLRWSRTSFRETLLSLPWVFKYPFTAFTVIAYVVMRWFFFFVILTAVLTVIGIISRTHYLDLGVLPVVIGSIIGFLVNGFLKQWGHLKEYPSDIKYLIPFLLITTFILTPIEWWGNLTVKESNWLTRKS